MQPDAVLHGSLTAFKLPEVLTFLSTTRKTGTLTCVSGDKESWLFFDDGALVYAGSNQEQFRLGWVLLKKKRISREQRDRIDELMRVEGGRFGQIAVDQGLLSDAQLRDFLKVQASEIVYDCFVWPEGLFAFHENQQLPPYAVTIAIDLPNLIMEGARRIEEWEQCLRLLPDKSVIFRVVATPRDEKITLTADEWRILFLINGQRTLEELSLEGDDGPFQVYRVMYGLYANKLIEQVPRAGSDEDTAKGSGDATMRQTAPIFHAESTMREMSDDTSLLMSSEERLLSYSDMVRPTVAQLTIQNGDVAGEVIALTESEYLIGRHRDNSITLGDLGISGFHARIYRGPDGYAIEDLKSRNGTWINGARVALATLRDGDRLHLGATDLLYEVLFSQ